MVGDLEDVDGREVGDSAQERTLGGGFQVAEEEHAEPRRADQQGDAGVVGVGVVGGAVGGRGEGGRGRPQHTPVQGAQAAALPWRRAQHGDPGGGRLAADEGGLVGRFVEGGGLDGAHGAPPQDPGQAGDVVGVEVGEDEQRDGGDPQGAQTAVDEPGLRAGVDHDGGAVPRREHQRVALADVAGHQPPGRRRPARHRAGQRHRAHEGGHEQQRGGGAQPGAAQEPAPGRDHHDGDGGQQQGARPGPGPVDRRPGQRGTAPGHRSDPAGRPAGDPGEGLGDGHGERRRRQGGETEHGGRAHREFGQQVARHGDQADVGGQHRHHGRAHRLRRRRSGQDLREARRHPPPPQGGAPARREEQERTGGQHGQREAVGAGEPGVEEEQEQGGPAQRGQQAAATARADGQQRDQSAGGGAQHARVRPAHDDEGRGEGAPEHGRHTEREGQPGRQAAALGAQGEAGRADQQDQYQGEVGTADRGQMGQVGVLESLVQLHRDAGRVPDDQPGKQGPRVGRQ